METITPPADADVDARTVLTVGDGNFSFSLAFARRFPHAQLTASSFDSAQELAAKYPEAPRHLRQLRALGARVLHRVDATQLRASLTQAAATFHSEKSKEEGKEDEQLMVPLKVPAHFDVIVFNHPHCGEENVRRHRSLLSHFYASARELLAADGEIRLTLAAEQPVRWDALARARLAGLRLKHQVADVDGDEAFGLAYERKRHQNGRSFHRVLLHGEKLQQQSTLFIFEREVNEEADPAGDVVGVGTTTAALDVPSRKRKAPPQQQPFACAECENKSFKTAQGLKTHAHMVHELSSGGGGVTRTTRTLLLPCGLCDRTFKHEDAQRQHRLAKHGSDPLIRPDWFEKQHKQQQSDEANATTATAVPTGPESAVEPEQPGLTCSICHLTYPTQATFDEHWQELRPIEAAQHVCSYCGRSFDAERALRQHQNFCRAGAKTQMPQELPCDEDDNANGGGGAGETHASSPKRADDAMTTA